MATDKPRFSVTFTDDSFKKIREYQKDNNISTQSKAVAQLVEIAINELESEIDAVEQEVERGELSLLEREHIKKYRILDAYGKDAVNSVLDVEYRRCKEKPQSKKDDKIEEDPVVEVVYFAVPGQLHPSGAGGGQYADCEETETFHLIKQPPRGTSFIVRVSGDSMEPTFHNGDLLFIRSTVDIWPGQIGIFFMDGQQWIKECGDGQLISHNPAYGPEPFTEDVRCQGIVLGVCDDSYFEK